MCVSAAAGSSSNSSSSSNRGARREVIETELASVYAKGRVFDEHGSGGGIDFTLSCNRHPAIDLIARYTCLESAFACAHLLKPLFRLEQQIVGEIDESTGKIQQYVSKSIYGQHVPGYE